MSAKGKKQSLFIGKRVPWEENGIPILYPRYTKIEEAVVGVASIGEEAQLPTGQQEKRKKKRKRAEEDPEHTGDPLEPQPPSGPISHGMEVRVSPPGGNVEGADQPQQEDKGPPSKKEKKKKRKRDKEKGQEEQPGGEQAVPATSQGTVVAHGVPDSQGATTMGTPPQGNAEEAEKIRSVLGFTGPSRGPSSMFNFSFSVQEEKDREAEEKLNHILMVDSSKDGFLPRRVYVGGMPFSWTEDQVREYWSYCGDIESLDVMTFPDTGRFRGLAFITFKTDEAYEGALACDGEQVEGQTLRVQKCKPAMLKRPAKSSTTWKSGAHENGGHVGSPSGPPGTPHGSKVAGYHVAYVGNIPYDATTKDLHELFSPLGCTRIRLHTDKESGQSKGYAHVHFDEEAALDQAVEQLNQAELLGRRIKVSYGQPKKSS